MPERAKRTRVLAGLCAVIGWTGLAVQLWVLLVSPLGPVGGVWRFAAYFTILTNILAAFLYTRAARKPEGVDADPRLYTAVSVYMGMVGITYVLLLQAIWSPQGWMLVADVIMHHIAPAASVVFWLVCVPKSDLQWRDAVRWSGYPLVYLAYALARGALDGFYPYFFIDAGKLAFSTVFINAAGLLIAFTVLGAIFIAIGKALSAHKRPASISK